MTSATSYRRLGNVGITLCATGFYENSYHPEVLCKEGVLRTPEAWNFI